LYIFTILTNYFKSLNTCDYKKLCNDFQYCLTSQEQLNIMINLILQFPRIFNKTKVLSVKIYMNRTLTYNSYNYTYLVKNSNLYSYLFWFTTKQLFIFCEQQKNTIGFVKNGCLFCKYKYYEFILTTSTTH